LPIDFDRQLLFFHIPKTAGTTISKCLNMYYDDPLRGRDKLEVATNIGQFKVHVWKQHLTEKEIKLAYFSGHEDKYDNFFKFTFVRNPWDRFVSNFLWLKYHKFIDQDCSLKESIAYIKSISSSFFSSDGNNNYRGITQDVMTEEESSIFCHFRPQSDYFSKKIHYVGRYENLSTELENLCTMIDNAIDRANKFNRSGKTMKKKLILNLKI
jgi:hypothetical protein